MLSSRGLLLMITSLLVSWLVTTDVQTSYSIAYQPGCPTGSSDADKRNFVKVVLPSIGSNPLDDFLIAKSGETYSAGATAATVAQLTSRQKGDPFKVQLITGDILEIPLPVQGGTSVIKAPVMLAETLLKTTLTQQDAGFTYSGSIEGAANSFAPLYLKPNAAGIRGSISGFIIRDRVAEQTSPNVPTDNWYVIEPLIPLLEEVLSSRPLNPCANNLGTVFSDADDQNYHIIYEVRTTNFSIQLDANAPVVAAPSTARSGKNKAFVDDHEGQPRLKNPLAQNAVYQPPQLNLLVAYDEKFATLKGGATGAQSDLVSMLNLLTGPNLTPSDLITTFYQKNNVTARQLVFQPLPPTAYWPSLAIRAIEPNAIQLLCDFITKTTSHTHAQQADPTVVHLLTGYALGPVALSDVQSALAYASGWCDAVGCGGANGAIVGLAEGIGGWENTPTSSFCGQKVPLSPPPYLPITVSGSNQFSHHSLSQHKSTSAPSTAYTLNFDGLLVQRWALMVHEISHTLGAEHLSSTPPTVMAPILSNEMVYRLDPINQVQINACLGNAPTSSALSPPC